MREFTLGDGFLLSEILDKTNLQLDLNALADSAKDKDKQAFVGGQLILTIVKKLHLAQNEVIKLMADMSGESASDVKKWNAKKIKAFFTELFQQDGIKDFFN